jgi:hypothetical protein
MFSPKKNKIMTYDEVKADFIMYRTINDPSNKISGFKSGSCLLENVGKRYTGNFEIFDPITAKSIFFEGTFDQVMGVERILGQVLLDLDCCINHRKEAWLVETSTVSLAKRQPSVVHVVYLATCMKEMFECCYCFKFRCTKEVVDAHIAKVHQNLHGPLTGALSNLAALGHDLTRCRVPNGLVEYIQSVKQKEPRCKYCKSEGPFKNKHAFERHEKTCKANPWPRFPCFQCDVNSAGPYFWNEHKNLRYTCRVPGCGKSYATSNKRNRHENQHSGEKPFICDFVIDDEVCGKAYTAKESLVGHQRIHTGEKPYLCAHCSEAFRVSKARNNHQKKCGNAQE